MRRGSVPFFTLSPRALRPSRPPSDDYDGRPTGRAMRRIVAGTEGRGSGIRADAMPSGFRDAGIAMRLRA